MSQTSNWIVVSKLNEILAEVINSRRRFRTVAHEVSNDKLERICTSISLQRASYIGEIESAIRELGGVPDERGTALGKAHRSWIHIRARLSGGNPCGILSECIRGERFAIDQHEAMLTHPDLPRYVHKSLQRHLSQVKTDLHRLERLKDYFERHA